MWSALVVVYHLVQGNQFGCLRDWLNENYFRTFKPSSAFVINLDSFFPTLFHSNFKCEVSVHQIQAKRLIKWIRYFSNIFVYLDRESEAMVGDSKWISQIIKQYEAWRNIDRFPLSFIISSSLKTNFLGLTELVPHVRCIDTFTTKERITNRKVEKY